MFSRARLCSKTATKQQQSGYRQVTQHPFKLLSFASTVQPLQELVSSLHIRTHLIPHQ
jgi:hypothetical protein